MMKTGIALATAILLAGCGSAFAPQTLEDTLAGAAGYFNSEGVSIVNDELKATKMTARVEGNDTLVMRIEGIRTGSYSINPHAMTRIMRDNICEQVWNRRVFEKGGRLRIEFVSNFGKELAPIYFNRC